MPFLSFTHQVTFVVPSGSVGAPAIGQYGPSVIVTVETGPLVGVKPLPQWISRRSLSSASLPSCCA